MCFGYNGDHCARKPRYHQAFATGPKGCGGRHQASAVVVDGKLCIDTFDAHVSSSQAPPACYGLAAVKLDGAYAAVPRH